MEDVTTQLADAFLAGLNAHDPVALAALCDAGVVLEQVGQGILARGPRGIQSRYEATFEDFPQFACTLAHREVTAAGVVDYLSTQIGPELGQRYSKWTYTVYDDLLYGILGEYLEDLPTF
jgi:hypothetical protein